MTEATRTTRGTNYLLDEDVEDFHIIESSGTPHSTRSPTNCNASSSGSKSLGSEHREIPDPPSLTVPGIDTSGLDPQEILQFHLHQVGKLRQGHELSPSFEIRPVREIGSVNREEVMHERMWIVKTLASLMVTAVGSKDRTATLPLMRQAVAGLKYLKDTYHPTYQEDLDLIIRFTTKNTEPHLRTLDDLQEKLVYFLRAESDRTRVLNEVGLFISTYQEALQLINQIQTLSDRTLMSRVRIKIEVLQQSFQRIQLLIPKVPPRDLDDFRDFEHSTDHLLDNLQSRLRTLTTLCPPPIQIRIPRTRAPLTILPGGDEDFGLLLGISS